MRRELRGRVPTTSAPIAISPMPSSANWSGCEELAIRVVVPLTETLTVVVVVVVLIGRCCDEPVEVSKGSVCTKEIKSHVPDLRNRPLNSGHNRTRSQLPSVIASMGQPIQTR